VANRWWPQIVDLALGDLIYAFGDLHLYKTISSTRAAFPRSPILPRMKLNPAVKDIPDFTFEDFELLGYDAHPSIKAPIAV